MTASERGVPISPAAVDAAGLVKHVETTTTDPCMAAVVAQAKLPCTPTGKPIVLEVEVHGGKGDLGPFPFLRR